MPFLGSWGPFVPAVESTGLTLKTGTAARFRKLPHQRGRKHFSVLSGQCAMPETVEVESRTSGSVELVDARDGEASSSAHLFYGVVLDEILAASRRSMRPTVEQAPLSTTGTLCAAPRDWSPARISDLRWGEHVPRNDTVGHSAAARAHARRITGHSLCWAREWALSRSRRSSATV